MIEVIKPPAPIGAIGFSVFLSGSIEMGAAKDWQEEFTAELDRLSAGLRITVLNPRRDDWDSSWEQKIENHQFREQVEWELQGLERADVIVCHFEPETKSPITLLELGLFGLPGKLIVHCPEGYWRKGNVDIVCARYRIDQAPTLEQAAIWTVRKAARSPLAMEE